MSKISLKQKLAERITDEIAKKPKNDLEVVAKVQDLAQSAFVNLPKIEERPNKTPEPTIILSRVQNDMNRSSKMYDL